MKKIIATVLAMVMALALCTTAFATTYTDGYEFKDNKWTKVDLSKSTISYTNPSETKVDGKVTSSTVGYFTIDSVKFVEVPADDATYRVTVDGTVKYLAKANANVDKPYTMKAEAVLGDDGDKCGDVIVNENVALYVSEGKYYAGTTVLPATGNKNTYALVDGQVVLVAPATAWVDENTPWDYNVVNHFFQLEEGNVSVDAKGVVSGTVKCKYCPQTATVTSKLSTIPSTAKSVYLQQYKGADVWAYWTEGTTTTTTSTTSPKTFDAGIAMYVGMALTSVAGSAVVIGKKKEF